MWGGKEGRVGRVGSSGVEREREDKTLPQTKVIDTKDKKELSGEDPHRELRSCERPTRK